MNQLLLAEAQEKGRLLAKAIKIIQKLAKNSLADQDVDYFEHDDVSIDKRSLDDVKSLILEARQITSDSWFEHLIK